MPVAKKSTVTTLIVNFTKERETKGTHRFSEDDNGGESVVGTLYVKKHAVELLGSPEKLSVTIEVVK